MIRLKRGEIIEKGRRKAIGGLIISPGSDGDSYRLQSQISIRQKSSCLAIRFMVIAVILFVGKEE